MTVRARWSIPRAAARDDDPFADVDPRERERQTPRDLGVAIGLTEPTDELGEEVVALADREAQLLEAGVSCRIKAMPDTSCLGCPLARHMDDEHPLHSLCIVGRRQDEVNTQYAAATLGDRALRVHG